MATKKRGLTGIEVMQALPALKKLRSSLVLEEDIGDPVGEAGERISEDLEGLIVRLESILSGHQTLNFSGADEETLTQLNIVQQSSLKLQSGSEERIEKSRMIGKDEFWSSAHMYHHLAVLERLVPRENEATSRAWIDTFFFRASAMVVPGKRMILNMEQNIPAATVNPSSLMNVSAFTDYTVIVAEDSAAVAYRTNPRVASASLLRAAFFVTEAKQGPLSQYLPQAVCQLYASGKQLGKDTVRGALTNGYEWMFIILSFNTDGNGASYKLSTTVQYSISRPLYGDPKPEQPWPDVIAGILSEWAQKSFDDLDNDDWFEEIGGASL